MHLTFGCWWNSFTAEKKVEDLLYGDSHLPLRHIVFISSPPKPDQRVHDCFDRIKEQFISLAQFITSMNKSETEISPKLFIVSHNVYERSNATGNINVVDAGLWGMAAVMGLEFPRIWNGIGDCDQAHPSSLVS